VRADRESNMVAFSDDVTVWPSATPCQCPARPWEVVQLGNSGSPIETPAGWLVLTHAVGPMRTYRIGALLLDLDDPTHVVGHLREPLLVPEADERDGYVPNVVYSCGALVHAGTLVLPYGVSDAAIRVATVPVAEVLDAMGP
ncbi:MAG: glycosidase, partial [Bacteroidales bacterium]